MARTIQDATFYANNDHTLSFTLYNDDVTPVVALNIAGTSLTWALSHSLSANNPNKIPLLIKSTATGGITITDGHNGLVTVTISDTDTEFLYGTFYHELDLTDTSVNKSVQSTGTITLLRNVINP